MNILGLLHLSGHKKPQSSYSALQGSDEDKLHREQEEDI